MIESPCRSLCMGCLEAFALYRLLGIHFSLASHRSLSKSSPTENRWSKLKTASPSISGKWRNAGGRRKSVSADEVALVESKRRINRPIRSYLTLRECRNGMNQILVLPSALSLDDLLFNRAEFPGGGAALFDQATEESIRRRRA